MDGNNQTKPNKQADKQTRDKKPTNPQQLKRGTKTRKGNQRNKHKDKHKLQKPNQYP